MIRFRSLPTLASLLIGCGGSSGDAGLTDSGALPNTPDGDAGMAGDGADGEPDDSGLGADGNDGDGSDAGEEDGSDAEDDAGPGAGAHCSPGEFVSAGWFSAQSGPNRADKCSDDGYEAARIAGVWDSDLQEWPSLWNIPLAVPMAANVPYAGSIALEYEGPIDAYQFEIWGALAACSEGTTAQQLYTSTIPLGLYTHCFEVMGDTAYSHWIMVVRDVDGMSNDESSTIAVRAATFCAQGACPSE